MGGVIRPLLKVDMRRKYKSTWTHQRFKGFNAKKKVFALGDRFDRLNITNVINHTTRRKGKRHMTRYVYIADSCSEKLYDTMERLLSHEIAEQELLND